MSSTDLETKENLSVKIHPSLAQAAMRQRVDREYRLWTLARALDAKGSGRVRIADLRELIEAEDLNGLAAGSLRRLLRTGSPRFWQVGHGRLRLRGLGAVCKALGIPRLVGNPVIVPLVWARTLRGFRAAIYNCLFPQGNWSNPISRTVIEGIINRTAQSQRNYQKALGSALKTKCNAAFAGAPGRRGEEIPRGYYIDRLGGELVMLRRLPNSFKSGFARAPKGMQGRVNQRLRYSVDHVATETTRRLFYSDAKAVARRIQIQGDDFFFVAESKTVGNTALWSQVTKISGRVFMS